MPTSPYSLISISLRAEAMTIVRFIKQHAMYNAGELAGFSQEEAQLLVRRGYAVEHQATTPVTADDLLRQPSRSTSKVRSASKE